MVRHPGADYSSPYPAERPRGDWFPSRENTRGSSSSTPWRRGADGDVWGAHLYGDARLTFTHRRGYRHAGHRQNDVGTGQLAAPCGTG